MSDTLQFVVKVPKRLKVVESGQYNRERIGLQLVIVTYGVNIVE